MQSLSPVRGTWYRRATRLDTSMLQRPCNAQSTPGPKMDAQSCSSDACNKDCLTVKFVGSPSIQHGTTALAAPLSIAGSKVTSIGR